MIIEAVANASIQRGPAHRDLAKAVERAMADAVTACYAEGVIEPAAVKARMLAARAQVKSGVPY